MKSGLSIPSDISCYTAVHPQTDKDTPHIEQYRQQPEGTSLLAKKVKNNLQCLQYQCHAGNSLVFQHSPGKQQLLLFYS